MEIQLHGLLKASLRAREERIQWADHPPLVVLGIRFAPKEDFLWALFELGHGTTLRGPGNFFTSSPAQEGHIPCYAVNLRDLFKTIPPTAPRQVTRLHLFVSSDPRTSKRVLLRRDAIKPPLTVP